MITRLLTAQEIPLTFDGGKAFLEEAGWKAFNPGAFQRYWIAVLGEGVGEINAVLDNGKVVAALGCAFIEDPFTGGQTALEMFWWVHPDHRNSRIGLDLWRTFEKRAKDKGCKQIAMVHLASLNLQHIFERRGYKLVEQTFRKEI